jgi:hypothetical protein
MRTNRRPADGPGWTARAVAPPDRWAVGRTPHEPLYCGFERAPTTVHLTNLHRLCLYRFAPRLAAGATRPNSSARSPPPAA